MNKSLRFRLASLLLASVQILSAMALLTISVWFIAASAMAGHPGVVAGFNYVIPSAAIRFLAIIRIASGYFEKYFGHISLLNDMSNIRQSIMMNVFNTHFIVEQQNTARTLQDNTQRWAGRWAAVYNPWLGVFVAVLGLTLLQLVLLPELVIWWLTLLAICVLLLLILHVMNTALETKTNTALTQYLSQLQQWLTTSTIWHLNPDWSTTEAMSGNANNASLIRQKQERIFSVFESMLITLGLLWSSLLPVYVYPIDKPEAIWIIPLIVAASIRDWFGPSLIADTQFIKLRSSLVSLKNTLQIKADEVPDLISDSPMDIQPPIKLHLIDFSWQRRLQTGIPTSITISEPGIVYLNSGSGTGKSSFFSALTQELPYTGKAELNGTELKKISQNQRVQFMHYNEQFAHIFADTLAHNLLMAHPEADEEALCESLTWAGLEPWANKKSLVMWLGEQGRPISGGEKKRLALARAYLADTPIWLLDEPFEGLDSNAINELVVKLNSQAANRIIILASHLLPKQLTVRAEILWPLTTE